jgi:hypothetical protein
LTWLIRIFVPRISDNDKKYIMSSPEMELRKTQYSFLPGIILASRSYLAKRFGSGGYNPFLCGQVPVL